MQCHTRIDKKDIVMGGRTIKGLFEKHHILQNPTWPPSGWNVLNLKARLISDISFEGFS